MLAGLPAQQFLAAPPERTSEASQLQNTSFKMRGRATALIGRLLRQPLAEAELFLPPRNMGIAIRPLVSLADFGASSSSGIAVAGLQNLCKWQHGHGHAGVTATPGGLEQRRAVTAGAAPQ